MINGHYTDYSITKQYETLTDYLEEMKNKNKLYKVMYINVNTIKDLSFLSGKEPFEFTILYYGYLGIKALCSSSTKVYLLHSWNNGSSKQVIYKQLI